MNRTVKIESILSSQIPQFLSSESDLFKDFLKTYYITQSHSTGLLDIVNNISNYKKISTYSSLEKNTKCYLTEDITAFDSEIFVNSTEGFPDRYGLIRIDDEIITYVEKTSNSFIDCFRGFSGITEIKDTQNSSGLVFTESEANEHLSRSTVENLNLIFYSKLFEKFKSHYFPDFEKRELHSKVDLELILNRARDFYLTKGSDVSFKILFEILYGDSIEVFKPKEFVIKTNLNNELITQNILIEPLNININPLDLIGKSIYQFLPNGNIARASIYNAEYRPTNDLNLYEVSLDSNSIIYDFIPTQKTRVVEVVENGIIVDSTIGFSVSDELYVKIKNIDGSSTFTSFSYNEKSINKFLNISNISSSELQEIKENDELIQNNLVNVDIDETNTISFRLLNVIEDFDFSKSYASKVDDKLFITNFGDNYSDRPEFNSWLYNYSTYHDIESIDSSGFIVLYDNIKFRPNEQIKLIDSNEIEYSTFVQDVVSSNQIQVDSIFGNINIKKVKRLIEKSDVNLKECAYIQHSYWNDTNKSIVVASSGLPRYSNLDDYNKYSFNLVGTGSVFFTRNQNNINVSHYLSSGAKVYLNSNYTGISSGYYFIKRITSNRISLYQTSGELCLSYSSDQEKIKRSNPVQIEGSASLINIGNITLFGYESIDNGFKNQLLLKEFEVEKTLIQNIRASNTQIYNIKDAYEAF